MLSSEHLLGPYVDKSGSWSHFSHVPGMHSVTVPLGPFSCHRSFTLTSCQQCPPRLCVSHSGPSLIPRAHQAHTSSSLLSLSQMIAAGICLLLKDAGGMNHHCQPQQPYLWCFLSASLTQLLHSCFLGSSPLRNSLHPNSALDFTTDPSNQGIQLDKIAHCGPFSVPILQTF